MRWRTNRRNDLQTILDQAVMHAQEGHIAILARLDANKGVLLEQLQRVETNVGQIQTDVTQLATHVQELATWRKTVMAVLLTLGKVAVILWPILLALIAGLWFLFRQLPARSAP